MSDCTSCTGEITSQQWPYTTTDTHTQDTLTHKMKYTLIYTHHKLPIDRCTRDSHLQGHNIILLHFIRDVPLMIGPPKHTRWNYPQLSHTHTVCTWRDYHENERVCVCAYVANWKPCAQHVRQGREPTAARLSCVYLTQDMTCELGKHSAMGTRVHHGFLHCLVCGVLADRWSLTS